MIILVIIKYSEARSHVNWLSGEKTKDHLCPRLQGADVLEMLVFSSLNQLTRLVAREYFIIQCHTS
jgi:hypothetical protein